MTQIEQNNILQHNSNNEVDLQHIFAIVWRGKWIIIGVTFIFTLASVILALSVPNEYKATAIVKPLESNTNVPLGALASQLGGLASLAGVNINNNAGSDTVVAMEVLKSWGFIEEFIKKHELEVPLFAAKKWDQSSNVLVLDSELYDPVQKKWVRKAPKGKTIEPTSWELYKKFNQRLSISQDSETGLVNISFTHFSPIIAKQWTDWLLNDINQYMKSRALSEANQSIEYLETQISKTSIAEIRNVFSELIQEQHKTKMLAQISKEFTFKTISSAKVPEEKTKPNRFLIVLFMTMLGAFFSSLFVLLRSVFKNK